MWSQALFLTQPFAFYKYILSALRPSAVQRTQNKRGLGDGRGEAAGASAHIWPACITTIRQHSHESKNDEKTLKFHVFCHCADDSRRREGRTHSSKAGTVFNQEDKAWTLLCFLLPFWGVVTSQETTPLSWWRLQPTNKVHYLFLDLFYFQ